MRSVNTTFKTIYQLSLQSCRKVKQNDKWLNTKREILHLPKNNLQRSSFLLLILRSSLRYWQVFFLFQYDPNIYIIDLKTRALVSYSLNLDKLSWTNWSWFIEYMLICALAIEGNKSWSISEKQAKRCTMHFHYYKAHTMMDP